MGFRKGTEHLDVTEFKTSNISFIFLQYELVAATAALVSVCATPHVEAEEKRQREKERERIRERREREKESEEREKEKEKRKQQRRAKSRKETTASYLKRAGEMISDGLIIAMIIRGLPAAYNAFSTVVTQRDSAEMDFQKFKSALKSEEETKKTRQSHSENEESVMKVKDSKIICYLAAIDQGASFNFSQNVTKLSASDGTEFNIKKCGKLYYLNYVNSVDSVNAVGSTPPQFRASTSMSTPVISPTRISIRSPMRTPIRIPVRTSMASPVKALVSSLATALARAATNPLSMTADKDNDCVTKNEASSTCKKKLFDPPSVVVATQVSFKLIKGKEKGCSRLRKRIRGPVINRRYNLQKIVQQFHPSFGHYITEFIKFKLQKKKRYTPLHKWMAINMLGNSSKSGYNLLRRMFPLPSPCTVLRALRANKMNPGCNMQSISMLKVKVNPQSEDDKLISILMDEMSLRKVLSYSPNKKKIFGYEDDGSERKKPSCPLHYALWHVG
ncbi:Transposase protein [Trinorchestia longiramus]|nr:Transposase protein [Trinorchestia longiramus]